MTKTETYSPDPKQQAIIAAVRTRKALNHGPHDTFCVFDAAPLLGIDIRFETLDSVDGMAIRTIPSTIILSSLRPEARRRFTCAHEIGHLVLRHPAHIDLTSASEASQKRPEAEMLADLFAGQLLMPKLLLSRVFSNPKTLADPLYLFEAACSIGVGLSTLLTHASLTAKVVPVSAAKTISTQGLRQVRKSLELDPAITPLVAVGHDWGNRPIDVDQSTFIHFRDPSYSQINPPPLCEHVQSTPHGNLFIANSLGIAETKHKCIRVMPNNFVGRSIYRYTEMNSNEHI